MKNQNRNRDQRHSRRRWRGLHAPARLGRGVEQIEPRIMLAGDLLTNVPALIAPVAENARAISDGGYVSIADSAGFYKSTNSFDLGGVSHFHLTTYGSSELWSADESSLSSVPRTSIALDALQFDHSATRLEFVTIKPTAEGGFAVMALGASTPVTNGSVSTGPISPDSRDAIATGVAAPIVRSTITSDAPLEAARGRAQAFELSASVQDVLRSAPVVNAHAVDAAMAQFGKMQPALTRDLAALRKDPAATAAVATDSPATIDRLLVAARQVEAQLTSPPTGGAEAASLMSVPSRATDAAQTTHRSARQAAELPAEALLAAQPNPEADRDSARKSLLGPLLELDSSMFTDSPGLWTCAVVVSLAGLYWQRTTLASQRWPARENEGPRLRRLAVRAAQ